MLHAIRVLFIAFSSCFGFSIGNHFEDPLRGLFVGMGIGLCAMVLEQAFARKFIGVISLLMMGIITGFVFSHFLIAALYLIPYLRDVINNPADPWLRLYVEFPITSFFCFLSVVAILHTKDEFKFVIPFVELKREGDVGRPLILDTSAIIDGRIADIMGTRIIDSPILLPRFVLQELHQVADSADGAKRTRGRRGLDILHRLQKDAGIPVEIQEVTLPEIDGVDAKLIKMASMINGRILTTDFNLQKVAKVQGVSVVNLNDLALSLRSQYLQGDHLSVRMVRRGENPDQGVGYLDDGTMVVGEGCSDRIGQDVELVVTNVLQTSAGRLLFGRPAA